MKIKAIIKRTWDYGVGEIIISAVILAVLQKVTDPYVLFSSTNFDKVSTSTITFVSILTGFLTSIIPKLYEIKNKSDSSLGRFFFKNVDEKSLRMNIILSLTSGFSLILLSVVLIAKDVISDCFSHFAQMLLFISLFSFCQYQLKMQTIYLKLLFAENKSSNDSSVNPSQDEKDKFDETIEKNSLKAAQNQVPIKLSEKIKED